MTRPHARLIEPTESSPRRTRTNHVMRNEKIGGGETQQVLGSQHLMLYGLNPSDLIELVESHRELQKHNEKRR